MERVGIYNRCSTEEESQKNALASQVAESREIALKMGWDIVEQYVESETGTVAYKRGEYQRLLSDMEKGRFDIVMIKSIDRLTRCARDWYFFLSRLTENGLKLYLYIEGKYYTPDDNLISGIKAILAEDFSRELSKKIKNAHRRRQEKKSGCNITCEMFGWNKTAKDTYEINEQEAEYYRTAFALAKEGKGFYSISNIMYGLGARGKRGNKISEVQWRKMLYTPRAHGTMILNQKSYDFDRKKYVQVPRERWIVMENALPPIVSREYQEEVIQILQLRAAESPCGNSRRKDAEREKEPETAEDGKRKLAPGDRKLLMKGKYPLSRKLVCAECGKFYYRTRQTFRQGERIVWKCSTFLAEGRGGREAGGAGCGNIHLAEEGILQGIQEAFMEKTSFGREECRVLEKETVKVLKKALHPQNSQGSLAVCEKEYKKLAAKKDML
ncbi:MAG: recombinase family protein, partial [Lachnospiraceae bacterium]|nr:recombinase family protein [Lachnospiraceae bacterium]